MAEYQPEIKFFAHLLLELRGYLAHHLGPVNDPVSPELVASHLVYAFHNEAEAILNGEHIDLEAAWKKIQRLESFFHDGIEARFSEALSRGGDPSPKVLDG